ncbi:MAG: putative ammonia monooxygenase [Anaerospora sp.]|nr:putative ammonia monooxygenase [Anaerospora sp.]
MTFLQALAGGTVFYLLNLPLPWTLGPLAAILVIQLGFQKVVYWPAALRKGALVVLGITMGSPFTMTTARQIADQLPVMLAATVATIAFSLLMGYITHKRTGVDLASSLLGSVPGGLSQMAVLSKELNADATVVTFMQTLRLLAVVFTVPFLARHGLAEVVDTTGRGGGYDYSADNCSEYNGTCYRAILCDSRINRDFSCSADRTADTLDAWPYSGYRSVSVLRPGAAAYADVGDYRSAGITRYLYGF